MTETHLITREIGIDAGHRVTYHGSKCRNLHGHRYTIQATCTGPLCKTGEQEGMVLDFGFLKEEMMAIIDGPCDHGMILWMRDPLLEGFLNTSLEAICNEASSEGFASVVGTIGKMYIIPDVPTAENLARHWFTRLAPRVRGRSKNKAWLTRIKVWETPNCSAEYSA